VRVRYVGDRNWNTLEFSGMDMLQCSPEQEAAGVWEWAYRRIPVSVCEVLHLLSQGEYKLVANISCCSAPGCNAPGLRPDTTTILPFDGPLPLADTLTCYHNLDLGEQILPEMPPAVYPVSSPANRSIGNEFGELDPSVSYTMKVESATKPGTWSWVYGVMPFTACYQAQRDARFADTAAEHVVCCAADLCNKPHSALDANTQVGL
jgi:hypothetical protein